MNHVWVIERNGLLYVSHYDRAVAQRARKIFASQSKADKWEVVKYTSEPELLSIIKSITTEFNEQKKKKRILEAELLDACRRNDRLREENKRLKRRADLDGVNT